MEVCSGVWRCVVVCSGVCKCACVCAVSGPGRVQQKGSRDVGFENLTGHGFYYYLIEMLSPPKHYRENIRPTELQ